MQSLRRTRPQNLDDLTVQVAIVRPGPIQGGAINPYIERRRRLREDPSTRSPTSTRARAGAARDAGHDHLPGPGDGGRGSVRRLHSRRGGGLRRAMSRKRSHEMLQRHRERFIAGALRHRAAPICRPTDGRARVGDGRGLRRLWLSQGARRRLRPARLPVDVAARPLRPGVPVRAAERAADGLLRARQPRARGRKPGHRGATGST